MSASNSWDEIGLRFGKLVAVDRIATEKGEPPMTLCKCDCGEYYGAQTRNLRAGKVSSCGCLRGKAVRASANAR